jgi:hypothetical protein
MTMKKRAGMAPNNDHREKFHMMLNTRLETDLEFRDLFIDAAKDMRKGDRAKMKQLFVQFPTVITMSPNLTADIPEPPRTPEPDPFRPGQKGMVPLNKAASVAPSVDAWFEKNASAFLTEAQRRYPELLKVAADTRPVPVEKKVAIKGSGATGRQSNLSGGSA